MRRIRLSSLILLSTLAVPAGTAGATSAPATCHPAVRTAVLPTWARAGFSEAKPISRQVLGRSGEILAIPFADPLVSPPSKRYNNKILWVARLPTNPLSDMRIGAQRMVGTRDVGRPVSRVLQGGPGPSIINLPASGCWRFSLRWSGRTDSIDLTYAARIS